MSVRNRFSVLVTAIAMAIAGGSQCTLEGQGPIDFLKRLDTNGNGMLDPNELEGRAGYFIRRMAQNNPRIDLSRPIPIQRLAEEFMRMREERMRSRGGGPSPGRPPDGPPPTHMNRGPQGRPGGPPSPPSSPYRPTTTEVKPLVPGFGVEEALAPAPGFGAEAELFTVEVTEQDRREAARAFSYYDRNRDGKIDSNEMKRSRYGADLPLYDRNRDGYITLNEMEYRYARRRVENSGSSAGRSRAAASRHSERRSERKRDPDAWLWSKRKGFGDRKSYRAVPAAKEALAGLPDWFARDDADGDGQVTMAEFSSTWSDAVLADYNQFDLNQDGVITPQECIKAAENGAVRGGSIGTTASTSGTRSGAAAPSAAPPTVTSNTAGQTAARRPVSPPPKLDPRYMKYFQQLIARYDKNGDKVLERDEWTSMSKNPEAADQNGDGRITLEEYARWALNR